MKDINQGDIGGDNNPGLNEDLHMENEILKLKMQAESGAVFGSMSDVPPDIENLFLKNVQLFEEAYKNVKQVKVFDFIGRPFFSPGYEMTAAALSFELERLQTILLEKQVIVDFLGKYEERIMYKFITEELFEVETDDVSIPGMMRHFTYEEFHPNHEMDIRDRAMEFISDFFDQTMNEGSWELSDNFISPDGLVLPKADVLLKIENLFQSYTSFQNCKYGISDVSFQWNDSEERGLGHAEGDVKYDAILENGEVKAIEGPFKLYLSCEFGWWKIYYFVFPGFVW